MCWCTWEEAWAEWKSTWAAWIVTEWTLRFLSWWLTLLGHRFFRRQPQLQYKMSFSDLLSQLLHLHISDTSFSHRKVCPCHSIKRFQWSCHKTNMEKSLKKADLPPAMVPKKALHFVMLLRKRVSRVDTVIENDSLYSWEELGFSGG